MTWPDTPQAQGHKDPSAAFALKYVRVAERDLANQSERAYRTMVANWRPNPPVPKNVTYGLSGGILLVMFGAVVQVRLTSADIAQTTRRASSQGRDPIPPAAAAESRQIPDKVTPDVR